MQIINNVDTNTRLREILDAGILPKAVKIVEEMSEETLCFTLKVTKDGKELGQISNDGHGGCDREHLDRRLPETQQVEAFVKERETAWAARFDDRDEFTLKYNMESLAQDLLAYHDVAKHMKNRLRRETMFIKDGHDGVLVLKSKPAPKSNTAWWDKARAVVAEKKGRLLADMPEAEAVKAYMRIMRVE